MLVAGCWQPAPTKKRGGGARRSIASQRSADVLLSGIAATLNDLSNRVDLQLNPEQPILTARTSDDGKEVLASCIQNPYQPETEFTYLYVPGGEVDFHSYDVQQGDIVRYYVNLDQEAAERGFEDRKAVPLRVRRVDQRNPSALIVEVGLTGPVVQPERMEIWRFSDERMDAIRNILQRYLALRRPAVGWEPSPDSGELERLVERCNQWWQNQMALNDDWKPDPLIATLPEDLRGNEHLVVDISDDQLRSGRFKSSAGRRMQQAVWCRDISNWARAAGAQKPEVAAALFDWTVRHVHLVDVDDAVMIHHPWQALVYGRGTAEHRAWVFVELCRQQQIPAVVLAVGDEDQDAARFWLPAALFDGELYLFDAQLGLPIPSPSNATAATLNEVAGDPSLLESLNIEGQFEYPVSSDDLGRVEAWVVASPEQLSRRYAKLQSALEGEDFVILSADNANLAAQLAELDSIDAVKLWSLPYQSIVDQYEIKITRRNAAVELFEPFAVRPRLWKARMLHFLGRKGVPASQRNDPLAKAQLGHQEAAELYMDRRVRPPQKALETLDAEKQAVYQRTKNAATYWLGELSYDRGLYEVAINWLKSINEDAESDASSDGGTTNLRYNGARYHLARAYEAAGDLEQAVEVLESDPPSAPQRFGNLLRARQLRQRQSPEPADDANSTTGEE